VGARDIGSAQGAAHRAGSAARVCSVAVQLELTRVQAQQHCEDDRQQQRDLERVDVADRRHCHELAEAARAGLCSGCGRGLPGGWLLLRLARARAWPGGRQYPSTSLRYYYFTLMLSPSTGTYKIRLDLYKTMYVL
jgi:hypothetical protein